MPARKKSAPQPQPPRPRPELRVPTRRGRTVLTLLFCLMALAAISQAVSTVFLGLDTNGIGITLLFAFLYLAGCVYLIGVGWSSVRLLSDGRPALEANDEGLILSHLPFLGTFSIPWSEVASAHVTRTLLLTHFCIVPTDARQILRRR